MSSCPVQCHVLHKDPRDTLINPSQNLGSDSLIPNFRQAIDEESMFFWVPDSVTNDCYNSTFFYEPQNRIIAALLAYNQRIPACSNDSTDAGAIAKIDLPKNSHVFVHGDFHGNFQEFIALLHVAKNRGYLDENFQVPPNFKDKIYYVFLGDYLDRGLHAIKLLKLLMIFKMQNPNQVFLLQGNHEWMHRRDQNVFYNQLTHFIQTLLLSLYIGVDDDFGNRNYIQFSHGDVELDYDPQLLLSQTSEPGQILYETISKNKPFEFSERVESTLHSCEAVSQRINLYVQPFLVNNKENLELGRKEGCLALNWGDLGKVLNSTYILFSTRRACCCNTSPLALHDYQCISSSENKRVVFNIVGHQHKNQLVQLGNKVIAAILGSSFHAQFKFDKPDVNNLNEPEDEIALIDCNTMILSRIRIPYANLDYSSLNHFDNDSYPDLNRAYCRDHILLPDRLELLIEDSEKTTSIDV